MNMRRITSLLLIGFLFFTTELRAQLHPNFLQHALKGGSMPGNYVLLVKGDADLIKQKTLAYGGRIRYSIDDIFSVEIPISQYQAFLKGDWYAQAEHYYHKGNVMDDQSRINSNVNPAHAGQVPLIQGYDGSNVVVGIMDSGLDFAHPDFKRKNGNTRVRYLWDQTKAGSGASPSPYNYGHDWDSSQINAGNCTHTPPLNYYGHGTGVTGIAAGNGQTRNNYRGMAPNADIVFVAIDFNGVSGVDFITCVLDATNYCFSKAAVLGKPCVINASLGTYSGAHDPLDLSTQAIEGLITGQNGRAFVSAAGNAGGNRIHLGYTIPTNDSAFTWFNSISIGGGQSVTYFELYSDYANWNNAYFSVGCDYVNGTTVSHRGNTKWLNALNDFGMASGQSYLRYDTILNASGQQMGIVESYMEKQNGRYFEYVGVFVDSNSNYTWRFSTKGAGKFDVWSHPSFTGTSLMRSSIPTVAQYPAIAKYRLPDTIQNIVAYWNCSPKVISVGNYLNRTQFPTFTGGINNCDTRTVGKIYPTSSMGPTRLGLNKPDISAPGEWTMSAIDLYWINWAKTNNPSGVYLDTLHGPMKGTSAASPAVAGIIALYLQKNPGASWSQIKTALSSCKKTDAFTGSVPNNLYGYGKVDAFQLLNCEGCTNSASANYNPYAQINDGSCTGAQIPANDQVCNAWNFSSNIGKIGTTSQVSGYDKGSPAVGGILNNSTANPPTGPNLVYLDGNTSAATDAGAYEAVPSCGSPSNPVKSVWFKCLLPSIGSTGITFRCDNSNTNFNTILNAYLLTNNSCNTPSWTSIACSNTGVLTLSASDLAAYIGQTLYIQLAGEGINASGNYRLSIQAIAPSIAISGTNTSTINVQLPSISNCNAIQLFWRIVGTSGYTMTTISPTISSYTITSLQSGKAYQVWAKYISSTQAFFSVTLNASTSMGCSNAVAAPSTAAVINHCGQVSVSWPSHPLALASAGYRLYWSKQGSAGYSVVAVTGTNYTISGLNLNDNYTIWYKVLCTGGAQLSSPTTSYATCGGAARGTNATTVSNDHLLSGDYKDFHFENVDIREVALQTEDANMSTDWINYIQLENKPIQLSNIEEEINIWPNPSAEFVHIQISNLSENQCSIAVLGMDGRAIQLHTLPANESGMSIDTRFLPDGIYLLRIEKDGNLYYKKVVIQH